MLWLESMDDLLAQVSETPAKQDTPASLKELRELHGDGTA